MMLPLPFNISPPQLTDDGTGTRYQVPVDIDDQLRFWQEGNAGGYFAFPLAE
jgi:hypothetical protein